MLRNDAPIYRPTSTTNRGSVDALIIFGRRESLHKFYANSALLVTDLGIRIPYIFRLKIVRHKTI